MKNRIKRVIATCALVIGLIFGGFLAGSAIADVPSSTDGTITSCVRIINGNVRIIDAESGETCSATLDNEVVWKAFGGTVYQDENEGPNTVNSFETVATVTVPAGSYQITGKAWIDTSVGSEGFSQCGFTGLGVDDRTRLSASSDYLPVIAQEAETFTTPTTIDFYCTTDGQVDVYNAVLLATTVSAVNNQ